MSNTKTLVLSVVFGFLAVIFSALYLHMKEVEVTRGGELRDVLVAAVDIKQNTFLEPGLVKKIEIPLAFIQPAALTNKVEVAGKVNIMEIKKGEQVLGTKLVVAGANGGLSSKLARGKRAVSIALKEADSAGGLVQPDDLVDIVVTFDYGESDKADKYTYTLFQNVPVLAVGTRLHSIKNPEGVAIVQEKSNEFFGGAPPIARAGGSEKVITLALDPEEALKLIFAKEAGEVSLALRSPMDMAVREHLQPVKIDSLTGIAGFTRKNYKEYRGR